MGTLRSGVYKSTNRGEVWSQINRGLTIENVRSLVIDPKDSNTVYAGTNYLGGAGGVFKTTDGGANWSDASRGLTDRYITSLAMDPNDPNIIYASTQLRGVHKSTNGGGKWLSIGLDGPRVTSLAIDPNDTDVIYVGTQGIGLGTGVFKSTDGGRSWSEINAGLRTRNVTALAIDPNDSEVIYVGIGAEGVYKSTNGGENWSEANKDLTIDPLDPSPLIQRIQTRFMPAPMVAASLRVTTAARRGTESKDQGSGVGGQDGRISFCINECLQRIAIAWILGAHASSVLPYGNSPSRQDARRSESHPNENRHISDKPKEVLRMRKDISTKVGFIILGWLLIFPQADTLASSDPGRGNIQSIAIDPNDTNIIYACALRTGIYKTTDGGKQWSLINTGLTSQRIVSLAVDPKNSNTVFAGASTISRGRGGFFKSTNGGESWSLMEFDGQAVFSLRVDPRDSNIIFALVSGRGVVKSTDGGETWSAFNNGLPNLSISSLAIDPSDSDTLYAGLSRDGLFKSTDGGQTWSQANQGLPNLIIRSLTIDPLNPNTIYAGTWGSGVFKSTDGGQTWSQTGLDREYIYTLAIDPTDSNVLYAAPWNRGIYKSTDGGQTWFPIGLAFASAWPERTQPCDASSAADPCVLSEPRRAIDHVAQFHTISNLTGPSKISKSII